MSTVVGSVLAANTRNVAQQPSTFSTLNTLEHVTPTVVQSTFSLVVGIDHGVPLPAQVYSIIGLVLHPTVDTAHPRKPRSQVSKHASAHSALSCNQQPGNRIHRL